MESKDGGLYLKANLDIKDFVKNLGEMKRALLSAATASDKDAQKMTAAVNRATEASQRQMRQQYLAAQAAQSSAREQVRANREVEQSLDRVTTGLKRVLSGYLGFSAAKEVVSQTAKIRGEFQQLEIAFETMLKSKDAANKLMMDAVAFAAKTPFTLTDVASNIKQLMAMGVAAEDVMDTLKALGDVAAGVSVPISRLAINYGQILTLGKLQEREIRDFAMAGVDVIGEIAKNLGKTKTEVQELVSESKIGAAEVTKAFKTMTSESGSFYNLMEKQNKSVTGQMSNLTDKIQVKMNALGEANEGLIYSAISGAAYAVENYEQIGKAILELVAMYGAYRAVLIVLTAAQKFHIQVLREAAIVRKAYAAQGIVISTSEAVETARTNMLTAAKLRLTAATRSLNAAISANIYVIAAAAVAALAYGIYKLATYTTDYEKSLKKIDEATKEYEKSLFSEELQLRLLYEKLKLAREGTKEYDEAKKAISSKYGAYINELEREQGKVIDVAAAYDLLATKIREAAKQRAFEKTAQALGDDLAERQIKALDEIEKKLVRKYGKEKGGVYALRFRFELEKDGQLSQEMQEIVDSFAPAGKALNREVNKAFTNGLKGAVDEYKQAEDDFDELLKDAEGRLTTKLEDVFMVGPQAPEEIEKLAEPLKTSADLIKEAADNVRTLKEELEKIKSGKETFKTAEEWSQAIEDVSKKLKEAEGVLSTLTGLDDKKFKEVVEEYNKWLVDAAGAANDKMVELQLKQEKDRIDAMEDGAAKRKAQFSFEQKESLSSMQKYVRDIIDEQAKLKKNEGKVARYGTFEVGVDGLLAFNLAKNSLQPTSGQLKVINEMVRQWNQRIVDLWVNDQANLDINSGYRLADELIEKLDQELIAGLAKGGFNPLKQQASIIFADISELSSGMIQQIIANAEKYLKTPGLTDEAVAEYRRAIDKANEYLVENNPWEAIKVAQERYVKAIADYNKAKSDYDEAKQAGDIIKQNKAIGEQNAAILEQASALSIIRKSYEEIGSLINELSGYGGQLAEIFGVDSGIISSIKQMIDGAVKLGIEIADITQKSKEAGENAVSASKSVTQAANDTGDSIKQVGATSGSAIVAIIGAVIQIGAAIANIIQTVKEEQILKSLNRINKAIGITLSLVDMFKNRINPGDSFFTEDLYNDLINLNNALSAAIKNVSILWSTAFGKMPSGLSYVTEELRKMFAGAWDEFSGFDTSQFFNVDINKLQQYITTLESAKAGASEAVVEALEQQISNIEQIIDLYNEMHSKVREIAGDISGNMLSSVNAMWKQIREEGKITFEDLAAAAKKNTADVIDQMVSNQLWVSYMSRYFDQLGEGLTNAILQGGDADSIIGVFDGFWSGMTTGLKDYTVAYETFLKSAEAHGWDMSSTTTATVDTKAAEGSIKALRDELSKLKEEYEALSEADLYGGKGDQYRADMADMEKKIQAAEDLYNTKAIESLIQQQERLNDLYQEWIEMYGQEAAENMLAGLGSNPDDFLKALEARRDELQALDELTAEQQEELTEVLSKINSIYDAAHNAAAEVSQEAYNAWSGALETSLSNAATDYGRLAAYQAAYLIALNDTVMSEEDRAQALAESLKNAEELKKQITENLGETYRTDAEQRAIDLSAFKADLEWANSQGLPDLARNIQKAFDTYLLDEYKEKLDGITGSTDDLLDRYTLLQGEFLRILAAYAMTAFQGGDLSALKLQLEQITQLINETQKSLDEDLYDKYKTSENEYNDNRIQLLKDIGYLEKTGQDELAANARKQLSELTDDFIKTGFEATEEYAIIFGDLTKISTEKAKKALAAYRQLVEGSSELSEEAKAEILESLDDVQDEIDSIRLDNLEDQFSNINSTLESIESILSDLGVSETLMGGLNDVQTIVSGLGDSITAFLSGNWVGVLSGIAKIIHGIVSAVETLKNLFSDATDELAELVKNYDDLLGRTEKAIGLDRIRVQKETLNAVKNVLAELNDQLNAEQSKKDTVWTRLIGTAPDQELIEELKSKIKEYEDLYAELEETLKADFLQTDYESFSDSLSDILTQPWDSYNEMMDEVKNLTNDTIASIIRNSLKLKYLSSPINSLLDSLYAKAEKQGGIDSGLVEWFQNEVQSIAKNFVDNVEPWMESLFGGTDTGTTDSMKSINQYQADQILGQISGMRIVQTIIKNTASNVDLNVGAILRLNTELNAMVSDIKNLTTAINTTLKKIYDKSGNAFAGTGLLV